MAGGDAAQLLPDSWTDAQFESHLEDLLRGDIGLAHTGWPKLVTTLRRARINAGLATTGELAGIERSIELGGGNREFEQLGRVLELAQQRLDVIELERARGVLAQVVYRRFNHASHRLAASHKGKSALQWAQVCTYIAATRQLRGASVAELAAELGTTPDRLSRVESGHVGNTDRVESLPVAAAGLAWATRPGEQLRFVPEQITNSLAAFVTAERARGVTAPPRPKLAPKSRSTAGAIPAVARVAGPDTSGSQPVGAADSTLSTQQVATAWALLMSMLERAGVDVAQSADTAIGSEDFERLANTFAVAGRHLGDSELTVARRVIEAMAAQRITEANQRLTGERAAMTDAQRRWRELGMLITATRQLRGQSLAELATELGTHPDCVREIESGFGYDDGFVYYPDGAADDEFVTTGLRGVTGRALTWLPGSPEALGTASEQQLAAARQLVADAAAATPRAKGQLPDDPPAATTPQGSADRQPRPASPGRAAGQPPVDRELSEGHVSRWVAQVIAEFDGNQTELAARLGVTPTLPSQYKSGRLTVPTAFVESLIGALELNVTLAEVQARFPNGYSRGRSEAARASHASRGHATNLAGPSGSSNLAPGSGQPRKTGLPENHIARFLTARLAERGLTDGELASALDMETPLLARYLKGAMPIPGEVLTAMIPVLGLEETVTLAELRERHPEGHNYVTGAAATPPSTGAGVAPAAAPPAWRPGALVSDSTPDDEFRRRLYAQLNTGTGRAAANVGWATLVTMLRRTRIEQNIPAPSGSVFARLEAGHGHERYPDLAQTLTVARQQLTGDNLERAEDIVGSVTRARLDSATARIARNYSAQHFPGWETTPWPRTGAAISAALQLMGLTREQLAIGLGLPAGHIVELERGGGYDPSLATVDARSGTADRVDLRRVTSLTLRRLAREPNTALLHAEIEPLLPVVRRERERELDTYLRLLADLSPDAGDDWYHLVAAVYRARRATGQTRERFVGTLHQPMVDLRVLAGIERGGDPFSHDGYQQMRRVAEAIGSFTGTVDELQQCLARHKEWLDARYIHNLNEGPHPFPGWPSTGLPQLGLDLADRRAELNPALSRLALTVGAEASDIERAEAGFADPRDDDTALAAALMAALEFTDERQRRHAHALYVLGAFAADGGTPREPAPQPTEPLKGDTNDVEDIDGRDTDAPDAAPDPVPIDLDEPASNLRVSRRDPIASQDRGALINARPTRHTLDWTPGSSLTILGDTLPDELGADFDNIGTLIVYVRYSGVSAIKGDSTRTARLLRSAVPELESGRVALRVIREDLEPTLPHDFRVFDDGEHMAFVNRSNTEVNIKPLLMTDGRTLRNEDNLPLTPALYAEELITQANLAAGVVPGKPQLSMRRELMLWSTMLGDLSLQQTPRQPRRPPGPRLPGSVPPQFTAHSSRFLTTGHKTPSNRGPR